MVPRQRWARARWTAAAQHVLFTVLLALAVLGALAATDRTTGAVLARIGPALGLGAWYVYWTVLRRTGRPPLPYLVGALAVWAVMATVDLALLVAVVAVLTPYWLRRAWWAAAGVLMLTAAWSWLRLTAQGSVEARALMGCVLVTAAAVTLACYVAALDHETHKRQLLLDELTAAQAERGAAERQAGILTERERLAREVHDTLTQGFASIAMLLDAAHDDLPAGSPAACRVEQAMRTARDNLVESRRLVRALRPGPLDRTHLADAVRELTARLGEETGIEAQTRVTGRVAALPPGTEGELLRVVQEALTNARQHARAVSVTVTLTYLDDVLAIDIQDDGTGFAPTAGQTGLGLITMRERVAAVHGTLAVESAPGEGTTVAVMVPLRAEPAVPETASLSDDARKVPVP